MDDLLNNQTFANLVAAVFAIVAAMFGWLIKSFLARIHQDIEGLRDCMNKRDGKLEALQDEIRNSTVESVKLRSEINALWRVVEKPRRVSDG